MITGGRYLYIPAAGWVADDGTKTSYYDLYGVLGSDGVPVGDYPLFEAGGYQYLDSDFDHTAQDASQLLNPDENPCGGDPFCT